jgi:hypothetical protein
MSYNADYAILILSKKTFCKSIVESSFLDEAKIKTTGK